MCTYYSLFKQGGSFGSRPRILEEIEKIRIKWGQTLSLELGTFFNFSPSKMYIQWHLKRSKISVSAQFKGKRKVPDDVVELTEKI
ncbi:hypothetical protein Goshw_004552 [Gossypium schwendimanii]|uniref:Uncharacterized protein n=1 Tax=Gossypium schwendimanii TaxID=34291 RepID=A0A7J9M9Q4_GOSSC|nr:hypothetical protein [Gossypium schwendimanii]